MYTFRIYTSLCSKINIDLIYKITRNLKRIKKCKKHALVYFQKNQLLREMNVIYFVVGTCGKVG